MRQLYYKPLKELCLIFWSSVASFLSQVPRIRRTKSKPETIFFHLTPRAALDRLYSVIDIGRQRGYWCYDNAALIRTFGDRFLTGCERV